MSESIEKKLAMRFLLSKRRNRFFSVAALVAILGMGFGVAALLVSLSVISGFQVEYKKAILGFNSHLILTKGDEIENPDEVAKKFSKYESYGSLMGWTPFIYREGMAIAGGRLKGVVLKGIDLKKYSQLSKIKFSLKQREGVRQDAPALILGKNLAQDLASKEGVIRILFPQGLKPEDAGIKNTKQFFIEGTFESGLYEYDSSFAFLDLEAAKKFFQTEGRVSGIEIWLDNPDHAQEWARRMRQDYEFPYEVMTWHDLNENIFQALESEKFIFFLLMSVLVAVASLNILGTLMMLLLERRGEIAVLRTLGLTWKRLRKVFLFDGLLIGSVGIALGVILGAGLLCFLEKWQPIHLAPEIYFLRNVPVVYRWRNFFWVVGSAFTILLLGCELALRGISRVNILRALVEK